MSRVKPSRRTSLAAMLFGRMALLFAGVVVVVGLMAFLTAKLEIDKVYDGQLITSANVLHALMGDELRELSQASVSEQLEVEDTPLLSREDRQAFNAYAKWRMFRIWRDGKLMMASDTGPKLPKPAADGFSQFQDGRQTWRIYTLGVPHQGLVVEVGERSLIRDVLVQRIALELAIPLLLLIPAVALLIWLTLQSGLKTLRGLIAEIGQRTARDLSPLPAALWPQDLERLIIPINLLFERLDRSVRQERRFIDQAAHQLRTPLTAVKLQAQMIAREADPVERQSLIDDLSRSVERAAALTDRLLTLARLEAWQGATSERSDLRTEVIATLADLATVAGERNIGFSFEGEPAAILADPVLLRLIAANLIDNAVKHSPAGAEVAVRLSNARGSLHLQVMDAGPGVAAGDRRKVFERFYRGRGEQGMGGGLGLTIVEEAVGLLGGQVELKDRPDGGTGLVVSVTLPAADSR